MLPTTIQIVKSGLQADPTVTPAQRAKLLALLRQAENPKAESVAERVAHILRRAEVARRLSCSLRTVDKLPVKKVVLPGRKRAAGFLKSDIAALLTH